MIMQARVQFSKEPFQQKPVPEEVSQDGVNNPDLSAPELEEEQQYRASAYGLIAALLRASPNQALLDHVANLAAVRRDDDDDDLLLAMSSLGLSAKTLTPDSIEDEFHELFIGLGKGEVVPYGSWYLTGFMMEKPLSDLRDDLARLGYERSESVPEPEDHAAALCEVVSMMISEGTELSIQKNFYQSHMATWLGRFFEDLCDTKSSVFYKAVGRFGSAFMAFENEYFSMQT
ncbi:MAG: molecular chaperone TorD family protein [Gammaproteobacteria bacterium]